MDNCQCYCVNCENDDHEHCEFGCEPEDVDKVDYDPDPDGANQMWNER